MDDETSRKTLFDLPLPIFWVSSSRQLEWDHKDIDTKSTAIFADGTFIIDDKTELSIGMRKN